MKILFISKTYLSSLALNQLIEISKLGQEVDLVTPSRWGSQKIEYDVNSITDVKIHLLERYFSGQNHICFNEPGLYQIIQKVRPDIIHLDEEPYSLISYQCLKVIKKMGIPFVFFTWQNINKKYPIPFSLFEKLIFFYSSAAIAGSEEAKNVLLEKRYNKPVFVSSNVGVDVKSFSKYDVAELKNKLNLNNKFVIGYIGRLVKEKGIYLLLKAFEKISEEYHNVALIYIGCGPEKENLIKLTKKFNNIIVLDFIYSKKLPYYYSLMDIFVLPSLVHKSRFFPWVGWKEQFGRVLVEAMSCGVVVVGSSSGEIPRVIGDAGLVFREGDYLDLVTKLKVLIKNGQLRIQFAKRGRQRVIENYSCLKIAQNLVNFYHKVLKTL